MKNIAKRILASFLAATLSFSLCVTASAAGTVNLNVGDVQEVFTALGADRYEWSSDDASVASVTSGSSSSATITANGAGRATITVTALAQQPAGEETEDGEAGFVEQTVGAESWEVVVSEVETRDDLVVRVIPADGLSLTVGEGDGSLSADVSGAEGTVSYNWVSMDTNVATVSGNGASASVTPVGAGTATIMLTAQDASQSDTDFIFVTVSKAPVTRVMVSASSSTAMTMEAGEEQNLAATVSGGSGSYEFVWNPSGVVDITDQQRNNASIRGTDAGTGSVTLYVYDAEDHSNYDTVTWNVTVNSKVTPMEVSLSAPSLELNVGGSETLSVNAYGGSGSSDNYSYAWTSSNGIVTLADNGSTATVSGGSAGSSVVTVTVTDRVAGTSGKANCTVTVKSREASYNASGTATVGANSGIGAAAGSIASGFRNAFGSELSDGASVRLTTPSTEIGQLRLSDGSLATANTSYTFTQFSSMYLYATTSGSFSTAYTINDNGNVLTGTLTLTASGGTAVRSVSISQTSVTIDTYSSFFLNVGVMPSNAAYSVTWHTSNSKVAYVEGSGTSVTIESRGRSGSATITASVRSNDGSVIERYCDVYVSAETNNTYNPSLTLTAGSDYYGTNLAENFRDRYRSVYGYALGDDATIRFSSLGSTSVAVVRLADGTAIRTNTNYSFAQYAAMSVTPVAAGTISAGYTLSYNNNNLSGTVTIYVRSANVSASISTTAMTLAPNSNQNLSVSVTPSNLYYSVAWSSSNTNIAAVSGSGNNATVNTKNREGTATITATITDRSGVKVVRSCVVTVKNQGGNVYNPSLSMTLGVNYTGTSLSSALAAQFASVHGVTLRNDSATIRFPTLGDKSIALVHLADGRLISANTDYTFTQYIGMYVEPLSAGNYTAPYTLTYNGKSLTGTVMITVSQGSVNASLRLAGLNPYAFSQTAAAGGVGSSLLSSAITNAVGSSWSFVRFNSAASSVGTLYQNSSRASVDNVNISSSALGSLYFVPAQIGTYNVNFIVGNSGGGSIATGTLNISVTSESGSGSGSVSFDDVRESDWFGTPVTWAVSRSITNGTSATRFSPYMTCTTAHILTFLWRSKGSPAPTIANPFTDVSASDYFYQPALWAYEKGLVSGTRFNGEQECTRASTVVFLWKLAGSPQAASSSFDDVPAGTETASAVNWAVAKGITNGMSPRKFAPADTCNRGQIVTFLYRAYA